MVTEAAWRDELLRERAMKDSFMGRHPESPFVAERIPFHPLRYFPPAAEFRVEGRLERLGIPEEAYLRTNRDGQSVMRYLGDIHFALGGKAFSLRVYHAGEGVGTSVFIPFRDSTSGRESYGAGRYMTLELNESDRYDLDFNRAFNPYCAYTDAFECGLPPSENDLPVAVRAGEQVWAKERNPRTPNALILERTGRRPPKAPTQARRRRRRTAKPGPKRSARPARARPTARRRESR